MLDFDLARQQLLDTHQCTLASANLSLAEAANRKGGGGRAKALAGQLEKHGAQVHRCAKITKAGERTDFVRSEFRRARVKVATREEMLAAARV